MSEEPTQDLSDRGRSFEERVFARFDAIDDRLKAVETRVDVRFDTVDTRLEKLEARANDTKPIWERALKAIMELGLEMGEVKTEIDLTKKGLRDELVDVRRELKHQVSQRLDLILKYLLEDREDIRDAEGRLRELESKLA
jgi:hypothetical protein